MSKVRLAYSLKEAAEMIGVGRTKMYRLRKTGKIPVCEDSGYMGIMHQDLMNYLNSIRKTEPDVLIPKGQ